LSDSLPVSRFRAAVRRWTRTRERPLPWRGERDPYRILVSEVMLQQTQAARVAPAYLAFLSRFPDVYSLARSEASDVLRAWGSLGYPRRALDLRRAARVVAGRGAFPRTIEELRELPGVGPYTARAVATFAFNAHVGIVDTNVRRVFERCFGATDLQDVADRMTPRGRAAEWNQAMIDLGAEVCRPRDPRCDVCPVRLMCVWDGTIETRRRAPRFETTTRYVRGRIVDALRAADMTERRLIGRTKLPATRLRPAIRDLISDGLVHRRGARYALGPASERASAGVPRR
jgi:A/G-specific adenine glycosylase